MNLRGRIGGPPVQHVHTPKAGQAGTRCPTRAEADPIWRKVDGTLKNTRRARVAPSKTRAAPSTKELQRTPTAMRETPVKARSVFRLLTPAKA